MELYQLKTFVTVAEEGHLTRASERLHTSQPAISAHIKSLEQELGVNLFDRMPRGMQLTAAGLQLLDQARVTLDAAHALKTHAHAMRDELVGSIKIGLNTDAAFLRLADSQRLLAERHPRLSVHLLTGSSQHNVGDLRSGRLDLAFLFGDVEDAQVARIRLAEVRLKVAAPAAWADRIAGADARDLGHMPWIYTASDCPYFLSARTIFERHQCCQPPRMVVSDDEETLRELLRSEVGLAVMREDDVEQARREGYAVAWDGDLEPLPLHLAYLERRAADPALAATIDALAEVWGLSSARKARSA